MKIQFEKEYFEEVKLSDINVSESIFELQKKYYGKNIWLLLDK